MRVGRCVRRSPQKGWQLNSSTGYTSPLPEWSPEHQQRKPPTDGVKHGSRTTHGVRPNSSWCGRRSDRARDKRKAGAGACVCETPAQPDQDSQMLERPHRVEDARRERRQVVVLEGPLPTKAPNKQTKISVTKCCTAPFALWIAGSKDRRPLIFWEVHDYRLPVK